MKTKNTTVKIKDKRELAGFLRVLGTASCFISMRTETEVKMRKTGNPYLGTVKVERRNGLVNVNFVAACERNLSKETGEKVEYIPGETWYVHEQTVEGKPLPLCHHKDDDQRYYLQYFPHRVIGEKEYYLKGVKLTDEQVKEMKKFITKENRPAFKPRVITLSMDSIRELKARQITVMNDTISRIMGGKSVR